MVRIKQCIANARGYRHNFCCHRDWASKTLAHLIFTNWAKNAFWKSTTLSHADYIAMNPKRYVLTAVPGWRLERTRVDSMRCVNLGVALLVIGNILVFLCMIRAYQHLGPAVAHVLPVDATMADMLHDLFLRFKAWLQDNKVQCSCGRFTPASVHRERNTEQPRFKCKAAQAPKIVVWLAELTHTIAEKNPNHHEIQLVAICSWALANYFYIMKCAGRFFKDEEVVDSDETGHFLHAYSELRRISAAKGTNMWSIVPKLHQMHHIILDAIQDRNNPRFFSLFFG